ncbi:MAG: DEAD/DEAH box helicase [Gammaproteobacteria bacterium]|nr:DEAD/DEAH box helicase [Gammaproteobacteria bacterium]
MADLELRDYQHALADDILAAWSAHRAVLAWMPTGGGKSEVAIHLARREAEHGGHTLFVVDRRTLAAQARTRYAKYGMITGLIRGEDTYVRNYAAAHVATIQSLRSRDRDPEVRDLLKRTSLIVIDEAHVRFKHHGEILRIVPRARALGLSATPLRQGLGQTFGALVRGPSYGALITAGHLVKNRYFAPHADDLRDALKSVGVNTTGDYVSAELSTLMRKRTIVGDAIASFQQHGQDRQALCFAVDVAHSKALCDEFNMAGTSAEHIDFRTEEEERGAIFKRFERGETRVLCSVNVLGIGFDSPVASCAIIARPTLSRALHVQMIGRIMRPHFGKDFGLVLDHACNVLRHGRVEDFVPPELDAIDKRSDYKARKERPLLVSCSACFAVLNRGTRVCPECGHERARRSDVHFVDAELAELDGRADADRARRGADELRQLYAELRGLHEARGKDHAKAAGTAFAQILGNFEFKAPWAWRDDPIRPPSEKTLRLATSWRIAWAKSKARHETRGRE